VRDISLPERIGKSSAGQAGEGTAHKHATDPCCADSTALKSLQSPPVLCRQPAQVKKNRQADGMRSLYNRRYSGAAVLGSASGAIPAGSAFPRSLPSAYPSSRFLGGLHHVSFQVHGLGGPHPGNLVGVGGASPVRSRWRPRRWVSRRLRRPRRLWVWRLRTRRVWRLRPSRLRPLRVSRGLGLGRVLPRLRLGLGWLLPWLGVGWPRLRGLGPRLRWPGLRVRGRLLPYLRVLLSSLRRLRQLRRRAAVHRLLRRAGRWHWGGGPGRLPRLLRRKGC
jgi:hypothetical protein